MKTIFNIFALIAIILLSSSCNVKGKFEKMLDNREYDKAYAYFDKHSTKLGYFRNYSKRYIAKLQVSDLIQNGEYNIAKRICKELINDEYYVHTMVDNMQIIYEDKGAKEIVALIKWLPAPPLNDIYCTWNARGEDWREKVETYAKVYNQNIDEIINRMVINEESDYMEKIINTLIPIPYYKEEKNKKSGIFQSDMVRSVDANGKEIILLDYSEVNRIRSKYGFKPIK